MARIHRELYRRDLHNQDNHMGFIFQFVNVVYYIDLWILKNPCIPGIKATWS